MKNSELIEWLKQANPLSDIYFEDGKGHWMPVDSVSTAHFGEQGSVILTHLVTEEKK